MVVGDGIRLGQYGSLFGELEDGGAMDVESVVDGSVDERVAELRGRKCGNSVESGADPCGGFGSCLGTFSSSGPHFSLL